ncbi:MAG: NAD-dependent epimerase/dehydratase family protein [Rhodospirillales bacterium]
MPILVTGVDGLIGSRLGAYLADTGFDVVGVGRRPELEEHRKHARLRYVQHDLRRTLASAAGIGKPSAIIHSAGMTLRPGVKVAALVENNALATMRLLRFAEDVGVERFVYFSSISVHGEVAEPLLSEKTGIRNPSSYGLTKRVCELLIDEAAGIPMRLSLRLPAVLAAGAVVHWLSIAAEDALGGRPIRVFNPDAKFNSAVHIADLQSFVAQLLKRDWPGSDAVAMGSSRPIKVREVVERIVGRSRSRSKMEIVPGARSSFLIDNTRAERDYGYKPMDVARAVELYMDELVGLRAKEALAAGANAAS